MVVLEKAFIFDFQINGGVVSSKKDQVANNFQASKSKRRPSRCERNLRACALLFVSYLLLVTCEFLANKLIDFTAAKSALSPMSMLPIRAPLHNDAETVFDTTVLMRLIEFHKMVACIKIETE